MNGLNNKKILEIVKNVEKKELPAEYKYKQIFKYHEIEPFPIISTGLSFKCRNCGETFVKKDEKEISLEYINENIWKTKANAEKFEVFMIEGKSINQFCNKCKEECDSFKKEAKFILDSIIKNKMTYTIDQKKEILAYFEWFCQRKCYIYLDHFEPAPCPYTCFPLMDKYKKEINEAEGL